MSDATDSAEGLVVQGGRLILLPFGQRLLGDAGHLREGRQAQAEVRSEGPGGCLRQHHFPSLPPSLLKGGAVLPVAGCIRVFLRTVKPLDRFGRFCPVRRSCSRLHRSLPGSIIPCWRLQAADSLVAAAMPRALYRAAYEPLPLNLPPALRLPSPVPTSRWLA